MSQCFGLDKTSSCLTVYFCQLPTFKFAMLEIYNKPIIENICFFHFQFFTSDTDIITFDLIYICVGIVW